MRNNVFTTHLLACSFAHSLTQLFTPLTLSLLSLTYLLTCYLSMLTHSFIHLLIHSSIHSHTHSLAQSFTHSSTRSLTKSISHSLTHSLIHSFREALTEVYHRIDLDGSGAIGSTEFDFFHERTSNEPCDEDTWTVVNGWYFITLSFS